VFDDSTGQANHVPPVAPQRSWPLRGRVAAAAIAGGLVFGVAVALPIALLTRSNGNSSTSGGAGSAQTPAPATGLVPGQAQARTLYQQALAATRATRGVHYVSKTTGGANQTTTGDAGPGTGTQDITVDSAYGPEQFSLVLIQGTVYFKGNAAAAQDQLGVPASAAPGLSGKWVSVVSGDGPYTVLQPGITTGDQATEMPLVATSTAQVTTPGGVHATRIKGTVPAHQGIPAGTAYMDVDPSTHLPVDYVSTVSAGTVTITGTTTFSAWGSAPSPAQPGGAVAWSTLGAAAPPGGYGSGGGTGATPTPAPAA
jgi:hypothetical protein